MIIFLLQSAFILTVFFITYKYFFARFTFFQHNRFFLLSGVGLSIILPILPLNFSTERTEYIYLPKNAFGTETLESQMTNSHVFWEEITWMEGLLFFYFIGVILFLSVTIFQFVQVFRMTNEGQIVKKEGTKLVLTNRDLSPFSFFNTIVINPDQLKSDQIKHILTHENIHINQWHQLDLVVSECIKIILWFFPLSWWYGKAIRANLEFIADENSLENGLDKKEYQLNLISVSQQPSKSVLVNNFSKKIIKNRIKMLNKMKTKNQILYSYAFIIPIILLISIGISVKAQSQNEKVKQIVVLSDEPVDKKEIKVLVKNKKGDYQELDSLKIHVISDSVDLSKSLSISTKNQQDKPFTNDYSTVSIDQLNAINPNEIKAVEVDKSGDNGTIIIRYKGDRKNDTIFRSKDVFYGKAVDINDFGKVLQPKELKKKIQKGEIDLSNPKNLWLKEWQKDNFKEPIDYAKYHRLLENWEGGVYAKNNSEYKYDYKVENLKNVPNSKLFNLDTLSLKKQDVIFENGIGISTSDDNVIVKSNSLTSSSNSKSGSTVIAHHAGNGLSKIVVNGKSNFENANYFIENRRVSKKEFEKLTKNKPYKISYVISDDQKMIKKYGKEIETNGLVLATIEN